MEEWFIKKVYIHKVHFILSILVFSFISTFFTFAAPYTMCTGEEFNKRIKAFLNGNDRYANVESSITSFERGYNPPDDENYYVDISEDNDGTVIAYTSYRDINRNSNDYKLFWYSDHIVNMNQNAAFMFDKFVRIRNIDLSGFAYLKGLTDTRYMFLECRNLKTIRFKEDKNGSPFLPAEIQGMFFGCQSLMNVDFTLFETRFVDNMDELFYKCYNLRNIYVDKNRWNIENVISFRRMFSECHCLRSNDGKKAVDVNEDDYDKYAIPGDDKKEGFIKDVNTTYENYGEYITSVPIDGSNYLMTVPETIQRYSEEPESDGDGDRKIGAGDRYIGDKSTGYNAEKEQLISNGVITPTTSFNPLSGEAGGDISSDHSMAIEATSGAIIDSTISTSEIGNEIQNVSGDSKEPESVKATEDEVNVDETSNVSSDETYTISSEDISERRVMELDDYLREQNDDSESGGGDYLSSILSNYKFLILALAVSLIVILLLVGMVLYLQKSNSENKDNDSHSI